MKIAWSVGHSLHVRGMRGNPVPPECDEVDECLKISNDVAALLEANGVDCPVFFDTTSMSQSAYLSAQANWTNNQHADLAVQCHLNAGGGDGRVGCEVWYYSQKALAAKVATAMANALGLPDRGPKYSSGLSFLVNTNPPAILLECFFGDSTTDCNAYHASGAYDKLIEALAESIAGIEIDEAPPEQPPEPEPEPPSGENWVDISGAATGSVQVLVNGTTVYGLYAPGQPVVDLFLKSHGDVTVMINGEVFRNTLAPEPEERPPMFEVAGRCSWFGGPDDKGVSPSEGLAFIYNYADRPDLFLDKQPTGTTGLARRLDPDVYYVACRWDYSVTPKTMLAKKSQRARVRVGDKEVLAWPADWGPNENTGRVADLSPAVMEALGIETDDEVEILYPA